MYSSTTELKKHMKRHEKTKQRKIRNIPCDICKKLFSSEEAIRRHKLQHNTHSTDSMDNQLYEQFVADNFDMTCDLCTTAVFTSIYEARLHYKECHNDYKGYVKCCQTKLRSLSLIRDHIKKHLNPESLE